MFLGSDDCCTADVGVGGERSCHMYPGCGCGQVPARQEPSVEVAPDNETLYYDYGEQTWKYKKIKRETPKAALIKFKKGKTCWVPKKLIIRVTKTEVTIWGGFTPQWLESSNPFQPD